MRLANKRNLVLALVFILLGLFFFSEYQTKPAEEQRITGFQQFSQLNPKIPKQAYSVIQLILKGGPFPYQKDGSIFSNREQRLPVKPKYFYREYTVATSHQSGRGAQRLVAGNQPPSLFYYTPDHYRTFIPIVIPKEN